MRGIVAAVGMLVIATGAAAQEGTTTGPEIPEGMVQVKEQHFRIGFNGYGTFDHFGDDHAAMKAGAAVVLPHFDIMIKYGLGLRLGFDVHYHKAGEGSVQAIDEVSGIDITYYQEYEDAQTVTTQRVDGWVFSYGMTIAFKYEVTVPIQSPAYRFFKWVQPYMGTGVGLIWTRTHTDIPKEMSVLIENENYRGANAQDWDPWSIQFGPAFNLFGGVSFNLTDKFRINLEVNYLLADVPGGDNEDARMRYATDGHHAYHESYKVNDLGLGGGFEFKF